MRNPLHFSFRSAIAALAASVCFSQVLTAQVSFSARQLHFKRASTSSKSTYKPQNQGLIGEVMVPDPLELRQPAPPLTLVDRTLESYHSPVNFKLLLPQSLSGVAENDPEPLAHVPSFEFAQASTFTEPNNRGDDLEYYARHVPVIGGLMQHVLQQSKAHPRVTRAFQYVHPEF